MRRMMCGILVEKEDLYRRDGKYASHVNKEGYSGRETKIQEEWLVVVERMPAIYNMKISLEIGEGRWSRFSKPFFFLGFLVSLCMRRW